MSRFVRPDTAKLQISNGDWLLVRKRLSRGEQAAAFARLYVAGVDGQTRVNPLATGMAQVTAYLLDWSLTDDDGQPVIIRGVSVDELTAALDNLTPEDFQEISAAIDAHVVAMAQERETLKKTTPIATASDPISPSPSEPAGRSSPSVN